MRRTFELRPSASSRARLASRGPRALHRFLFVRGLAATFVLSGCVPAVQYEEAQSAAEVAREAERRTAEKLASVEQELERLEQERAQASERAAQYDLELAEAALERTYLEKQRDESAALVTQLRGELARVGDHLRSFSDERAELGERLEAAQAELDRLQEELARARERVAQSSSPNEPTDAEADADAAEPEDVNPSSDPHPPRAPAP